MTRLDSPSERFRFDRSTYERPNKTWRCGRAAAWGKPCPLGPKGDGSCGGTTACNPHFDEEKSRWECRRPNSAGGPCAEGPKPDGTCAHCQPPCVPRRTLRSIRGRLALLALLAVFAAIGATLIYGKGGGDDLNSLSAGPLSASHARFVGEDCASCHTGHQEGLGTWVTSIFHGNDMTDNCLTCHAFAGEQRTAHNFALAALPANLPDHLSTQTECSSCHVEHQGLDGELTQLSDAQCSTCHVVEMESFAEHVAFDPNFPSNRRTTVLFDHTSHLGKHFPQAGAGAPDDCLDCHIVDRAADSVPTRGFDTTCASCHAGDIDDRAMTVFSMPELSAEQFTALDQEYLGELCTSRGSTQFYQSLIAARAAVADGEEFGDYESIAFGEAIDPVTQWVIGSDSDEIYDLPADDPVVDDLLWLYLDIAESGVAPLADLVEERGGGVIAGSRLLAGLSDATLQHAVCAWTSNVEVLEDAPLGGGWYIDGLALRYLPSGHADPVMRAWLDLGVAAPAVAVHEDAGIEEAIVMRDTLISARQGPGACTECHGVSLASGMPLGEEEEADASMPVIVDWSRLDQPWSPYVSYSHGPHISLLGQGTACTFCHKINEAADLGAAFQTLDPMHPASSFLSIGKAQCVECHGGGHNDNVVVAEDQGCLLCHNYHLDSAFRHQMAEMPAKTE